MEDKEKKDYKERYKRIGESEWFKEHYDHKSLGEVIEVIDDLIVSQKPMPPEFVKLRDENFWDLVD